MVKLYGRHYTRRELSAHAGMLHQFSGVTLSTRDNGQERGVRVLEFRTGSGLRFTVMVDRGFDIGECDHNGRAIGWVSPTGFRNPSLNETEAEGGLGWLRSFSGLLSTCGLDHILGMVDEGAEHYNYPYRKGIKHSLHGRVALIPAHLSSYGESWEGDDCTLFCEGVVQQSTVFGEDLHMVRRIEVKVGSNEIVLKDRVFNHGFNRTPHMLLYHIDIGHPVIAEGSRYVAPIADVVWAAHAGESYKAQGVGNSTLCGPRDGFREQVWQYDMAADKNGVVPMAVINDAIGFGFMVESNKAEMPCYLQWQNFQSGMYTMGIEPCTNHVLGRTYAKEKGELIWLEHGEERRYTTRMSALDGGEATRAAEKRIRSIVAALPSEYPSPSGKHLPIKGRS
jgi:Domain of unknown function (DUF4432)